MRQEKAAQLLELALLLRGTRTGLTLDGICAHFQVSERTAHRLRDAVSDLFPGLDCSVGDDQRRYWRLPAGTAERLVDIGADDIAVLGTAVKTLETAGNADGAARLALVAAKLKALVPADLVRRLEPDVEALMEAEGIAHRPGPRPGVDPALLATLRQAIKAGRAVRVRYRHRRHGRVEEMTLHPYGVLLGSRHYLIAHRPDRPAPPVLRLFSLPEIETIAGLAESFARDPQISIARFTERAFGIFQETPVAVAWRFTGPAVRDAEHYRFHPKQVVTRDADGGIVVRFEAGGLLEMCWHLFTWGRHVEILEPPALRRLYEKCLRDGGWPDDDDPQGRQTALEL